MKTILHAWARLRRLKWNEIRNLGVLCCTAIMMAFSTTLLDISVTGLFLEKQGILGIGFNYLLASILLVLMSVIALKLEQISFKEKYVLILQNFAALFYLLSIYNPQESVG